jgi:hypothetical protein
VERYVEICGDMWRYVEKIGFKNYKKNSFYIDKNLK